MIVKDRCLTAALVGQGNSSENLTIAVNMAAVNMLIWQLPSSPSLPVPLCVHKAKVAAYMVDFLETLHSDLDIQCDLCFVLLDLTQYSTLSKTY